MGHGCLVRYHDNSKRRALNHLRCETFKNPIGPYVPERMKFNDKPE